MSMTSYILCIVTIVSFLEILAQVGSLLRALIALEGGLYHWIQIQFPSGSGSLIVQKREVKTDPSSSPSWFQTLTLRAITEFTGIPIYLSQPALSIGNVGQLTVDVLICLQLSVPTLLLVFLCC